MSNSVEMESGSNLFSDDSCWFLFLITSARLVSGQLLQQRLRFLQILRIKPFGEPTVNLR
jgi:hypothetical protein